MVGKDGDSRRRGSLEDLQAAFSGDIRRGGRGTELTVVGFNLQRSFQFSGLRLEDFELESEPGRRKGEIDLSVTICNLACQGEYRRGRMYDDRVEQRSAIAETYVWETPVVVSYTCPPTAAK